MLHWNYALKTKTLFSLPPSDNSVIIIGAAPTWWAEDEEKVKKDIKQRKIRRKGERAGGEEN